MDLAETVLDQTFGVARSPERIDKWEEQRIPKSLCRLDGDLAIKLMNLKDVAQHDLLRSSELAKNYIWAMDVQGTIKIAVEELAVDDMQPDAAGYPRRKGYKHPSEEKKLGHPTLLSGDKARIAGELAFDDFDGELRWVFNVNSGRYCRQMPPSEGQVKCVAEVFRNLGLDIFVDDII